MTSEQDNRRVVDERIPPGIAVVFRKCMEVDQAHTTDKSDEWQDFRKMYHALFFMDRNNFRASENPDAGLALRKLASKYAMPATMKQSYDKLKHHVQDPWQHLEFRQHIRTFMKLAYSMIALLLKWTAISEDTWMEGLGDLARYRMTIEDDDIRDHKVWALVSRHLYSEASDRAPTAGRLYHHLAILVRDSFSLRPGEEALQQLFYYTKSLCVPDPFTPARESIMTLFEPHLNRTADASMSRMLEIDAAFVRAFGIIFSGRNQDQLVPSIDTFVSKLDKHIERCVSRWLDSGYFIGIALSCALLDYGSESNVIMRAMKSAKTNGGSDVHMVGIDAAPAAPNQKFFDALDFAVRTHDVVFRRNDKSVTSYVHVTLAFLYHMSKYPTAMAHMEEKLPWKLIAKMLNALLGCRSSCEKTTLETFPCPERGTPRPLPEDFAQRGLPWVDKYYPKDWFTVVDIGFEEKYFEGVSTMDERVDRCLWLGVRLASSGKWLTYDNEARQFGVAPQYGIEISHPLAVASTEIDTGNHGGLEIPDASAVDA